MKRLIAAGAVAGLLAAGCDYWGNLVDEKKITRARVTLAVTDAWTRLPLKAHCRDSVRGIDTETDPAGLINLTSAETGAYAFSCESDGYFPESKNMQVGSIGVAETVKMARMGKEHWYPGDPTRQVAFLSDAASLRYPDSIFIPVNPSSPDGDFRFEWKFAKNTRFNRAYQHPLSASNFLEIFGDAGWVVPGKDTLIVTMSSRLVGREYYEVGSDTLPIEWIRNLLPRIDTLYLTTGQTTFRVDCDGSRDLPRLVVTAFDPDPEGTCDSVVLYTKDALSALGRIRTVRACGDLGKQNLPLKNPFGEPQPGDPERILKNTLYISAYDNQKERVDTSISFNSRYNALPVVKIARVDPEVSFMTHQKVRMKFDIADNEDGGALQALIVKWEPGVEDTLLPPETSNSWSQIAEHAYATPGLKYPTARAVDFCGDTASTDQQVGVTIKAPTAGIF
ncbi:MAG: hypothetical protein ABIW76_00905 [Fibrobacteria bacterium]